MTIHQMKLNDRYFDAVANGIKTFEIPDVLPCLKTRGS